MSIGLLLITHPGIGAALLATACATLGDCPLETHCIEVPPDPDTERLLEEARRQIRHLDDGSGVLVLTDAYGATPSNLAALLLRDGGRISVVSGVNLPMLIRVLNYADRKLEHLACLAAEGGVRGIRVSPGETDPC